MKLYEIGVGPGAVGALGDVFGNFGSAVATMLTSKVYTSADAVEDDMIKGFNKALADEQKKFAQNPKEYQTQNRRNIDKKTGELHKGQLLKAFMYNFMSSKHGDLPETKQVLKKFDKNQAFVNGKPNRPYIFRAIKQLAKIFVTKANIK